MTKPKLSEIQENPGLSPKVQRAVAAVVRAAKAR